ncbi:S1 family peptidase [Mycolicibacterium hippocampi]|uniref:S1 family peptidase n=1 Tax=Mycolicibacterium hippocampi TaxID=659824 RepID=UPI001F20F310|nr:S1 family peptidase [Mycolicibacterium hippocampi]
MLAALTVAQVPAAHAWGEYPVASPGAYLVSTSLAGNGQPYQCTAGFTVRTAGGAPGMLTAGHCDRDPVNDTVLQRTPSGDRVIGHYVRWEVIPGVRDIGLVDLAGSSVPLVSQVDAMRVSRVMSAEDIRREQPQLCKSGARTGVSCGPITSVTDTQISFRAWDDLGDSGAPVYARQADGTVAAVGILFAHTDDVFGRIIHASLVAPVMTQWGLANWD